MLTDYASARDWGQQQADMPVDNATIVPTGSVPRMAEHKAEYRDRVTATEVRRAFDEMALPPIKPAGRKDDSGKLDMTLLDDMPRAIEAVVEVMQWAIKEKKPKPYDRGSWLGVEPDRYRAAIMRHMNGAAKQVGDSDGRSARFQPDRETNLLHLAHVACSALFALELTLREIESQKA